MVSFALAAVLALSAQPAAAQRAIEIQHFDVALEVEASGWLNVRETIELRFHGSWNGIERRIPVEYRRPQGGRPYVLDVRAVAVRGPDGQAYEVVADRVERGERHLRIRVPGAADTVRTVVIHYRVSNALRFWEELDELYWNVTGDEWDMPIAVATAEVALPGGVEGVRTASWTGGYGSRANAATVVETPTGYRFETTEPLGIRQGLTIAVGWNPGIVRRPGALRRGLQWLRTYWVYGAPLLSLLFMATLWLRHGRDPKRRPIPVQYEPPDGLSPAEVGTLVDERTDARDVAAILVDLAIRGLIRIEEAEPEGWRRWSGGSEYRVVPLADEASWKVLEEYERAVLRGVFGRSFTFQPGRKPVVLGAPTPGQHGVMGELHGTLYQKLKRRGYYPHRAYRPGRVRAAWLEQVFVVFLVALVGLGVPAVVLDHSVVHAGAAALLTTIPVVVFGLLMPRMTVKGARARERVLGFQEFLARVDSDRYARLDKTPELFERYLPYAMALGVEREWASAFRELCTTAPSWYEGDWGRGFATDRLGEGLGGLGPSASRAMADTRRSAGGSAFGGDGGGTRSGGGGGFSGGGFGGGGGSGW